MKPSDQPGYWIGRVIGAVIIAPAAYFSLSFFAMEDFSAETRLAIAGGLGLLFLIFGGNIWRWIGEIFDWS